MADFPEQDLADSTWWHPLDLPWDDAPGWEGIPCDRDIRPSLDEVLAVRRERQAMVRRTMESLTEAQLASHVTRPEPRWPAGPLRKTSRSPTACAS